MWTVVLVVAAVLAVCLLLFLVWHIHRFSAFQNLSKDHKLLSWFLAVLPAAALGLFCIINITTVLVILLHFALGFALCDFVRWIMRKATKRNPNYNCFGIAAIVVTTVYLGIGTYMAFHIFETHYALNTEKDLGKDLRIVEIADSHLGITVDGERFAEQMNRVQSLNPDLVVIVGDFVDDDTEMQDMITACEAFGRLDTTYGVYFVFGNHDNGYFNYRNFTSQQLRSELEKNGVTILEDESVLIDDRFYLVGRRDRSVEDRLEMDALMSEVDHEKYTIVLDHQPNDYACEAAAEADLVLSGHTHGGHIFPAGQIGLLTGANDSRYGLTVRDKTSFIVTSGISGWAIPIKTGTFSEFVVIDIHGK